MSSHPFAPLKPEEIRQAAQILRASFPDVSLRFKIIDLKEPVKSQTVPYLEAERTGSPLPAKPARVLYVFFHRLDTKAFLKALVNIDDKKVMVVKELPTSIQGPMDIDEMFELEQVCLSHPKVLEEIEKLKLPTGVTVCTDPWIYGTDDINESRRLTQFYMYLVDNHPDSNHYSLPLKFSPVFNALTKELVRIDYLPSGTDATTTETQPWKPVKTVQYAEALLEEPMRTDLKPYIVQQPEGPSFKIEDDNLVSWQKWRFRVRSTYREGVVLSNITYDGRNVVYRMAINEMSVPYGDPRAPYHRKQAFDAGDVGFGATANQLELGCDCLGHIKYFDGIRSDSTGNPVQMKNVICLHEQDAGLQFKHSNYRTNNATVVRNRQLVVQMICTLANYEYIFAYIFDQVGGIEIETRATGILSTIPIDEDTVVPWGTNVGPGVMAPYHQHLFSLRIDPAIDGYANTAFYEDSIPMPPNPTTNPYGVGYTAQKTIIHTAGHAQLDASKARTFKVRNDAVINAISRKPVAYKLHVPAAQMMIMHPDSFSSKRARFGTQPFWFTKQSDDELYAAGEFTNQSKESTGVEMWSARGENLENEDLVIWHTYGITHNPRPEDFPVMPVERISIMFKPDGFFEKNPALDVPQSVQSFNKSTLHGNDVVQGAAALGGSCCEKPKL